MNNEFPIVDPSAVVELLSAPPPDPARLVSVLAKAAEGKGLDLAEAACLMRAAGTEMHEAILAEARRVKELIYGRRVVLFAPLYLSSHCRNDCLYCGFRSSNHSQERHRLSLEEIRAETRALVAQGHRRVLVVAGDDGSPLRYLMDAIRTVYDEKGPTGEIRRINVNVAAMGVDGYRELKSAGIGTYQLFQETYHPRTYAAMHPVGPKSDYAYHLSAMGRAIEGGIEDVGLGVLYGLGEWRFETLSMLQHAFHLESRFGFGPHTVSVPRLEPADGSPLSSQPPSEVSDPDFLRIIAVLRLTLPYAGIILSTRETAHVRRQGLEIGVSQISAGSRTNPGGYATHQGAEQFSLGDTRTLDEVVADLVGIGHVPSFCTGCYRKGRTGHDFMDLAKPGTIQHFCLPNALTSFQEYLTQAASPTTRALGETAIESELSKIESRNVRERTRHGVEQARAGAMDLYV